MGAVNGAGKRPPRHGRHRRACGYNARMYIIAIGWLWVALMMAITEPNIVAGILSFVFYGLLPCLLLLWLLSTPARRRQRARAEAAANDNGTPPDGGQPQ